MGQHLNTYHQQTVQNNNEIEKHIKRLSKNRCCYYNKIDPQGNPKCQIADINRKVFETHLRDVHSIRSIKDHDELPVQRKKNG